MWQSYLELIWPRVRKSLCFSRSIPLETWPSEWVSESTKRWQGARSPEGPTPTKPKRGPARMRFVHALNQLRDRVADVGEAVHFAAQGKLQPLIRQDMKLFQHTVHAFFVDGVEPVRRGCNGRKADLVKAEIVLQVAVNPQDVGHSRGESDARRDRHACDGSRSARAPAVR